MKRNCRKKKQKYNVDRTIVFLNNYKYKPKPIPEVGKRYHCFDDGKITFSRHFIIKVDEVLGFMQFKKQYVPVIGSTQRVPISLSLLLKEKMMNLESMCELKTEVGSELAIGIILRD